MQDKHILITGATNGIGLAAAAALAALGANVAIVGRSETRARVAPAQIRAVAKAATVATFVADRRRPCARGRPRCWLAIRGSTCSFNNAGAMYGTRQLTKDGLELTWAVNHLAPFLLTTLLLDRLIASAPARIARVKLGFFAPVATVTNHSLPTPTPSPS